MPFSAKQTKTVSLAYPDWPTQATEGEYFSETIQYSGNIIGTPDVTEPLGWPLYYTYPFNRTAKIQSALIRHPNGNIYGFPNRAVNPGDGENGNILIYDPSAGPPSSTTVTTSTTALQNVMINNTFTGGVLGGNGNIYLPPGLGPKTYYRDNMTATSNSNIILEYDAVNDTHRTISTGLTGNNLFAGGFTDTTGNVFLTPWDHPGGFTKIDCSVEPVTITNNITFGYSKITNDKKFIAGTAHPNGKCYLYPSKQVQQFGTGGNIYIPNPASNIHILEIDPITETSVEIDTNNFLISANNNVIINATLCGPDGKIYGIPRGGVIGTRYAGGGDPGDYGTARMLKFDPRTGITSNVTGYARESSSGMFAPNGILIMMPGQVTEEFIFHDVQTDTNISYNPVFDLSGTWEFTNSNAMACDEANIYVAPGDDNFFGIIPINQLGGTNANAYTLSAYVQNTN